MGRCKPEGGIRLVGDTKNVEYGHAHVVAGIGTEESAGAVMSLLRQEKQALRLSGPAARSPQLTGVPPLPEEVASSSSSITADRVVQNSTTSANSHLHAFECCARSPT